MAHTAAGKPAMSRILVISNHSYMLYRFRIELLQALAQHHEVILSAPYTGHEEDFMAQGFRCIETKMDRRGINPAEDLKLFATYQSLLRQVKPDLVITYSIKPNIYAGLACSLAGIPYCANVQGLGTAFQHSTLALFVSSLYKLALRKANTVFFENQGNVEEFCRRRIIAPEKSMLLPGAGVNLERFPLLAYPNHETFHFLYVGRIMKEKGMDELFAAIRRLHEEAGEQIVLDLVGFFDDDYHVQVKQLVEEGIAVFHGFQTDPLPFYACADCVVLPSHHEGMSNVLLEASATGRPVIASNIHGCAEIVEPERNGFLCQAKDAGSLYLQMKRMFCLSRKQRAAMGLSGRQKVTACFDKRMVVSQTLGTLFGPGSCS